MNAVKGFCPKCRQIINICMEECKINVNCQCGYKQLMTLTEYIMNCEGINPNVSQTQTIEPFLSQIDKGYNHINVYLKELKEKHINILNNTIKSIESSYERCRIRNMTILSLINFLLEKYSGISDITDTIMKSRIIISECPIQKAPHVILYFDHYNIYENYRIKEELSQPSVKIPKIESNKKNAFQNLLTIKDTPSCINSLLLLRNKKIAYCCYNGTISVINPKENYSRELMSGRHSGSIYSICELDDGTIVTCSDDQTIKIGDKKIKSHEIFTKVLALPNNRIVTCSNRNITIWLLNNWEKEEPQKTFLYGHKDWVRSLLYMKKKNALISGSWDKTLRCWDMESYTCFLVFNSVQCDWTNSLHQVDDSRFIVGTSRGFVIGNIDTEKIEKKDDIPVRVKCFAKLTNSSIIVCGCERGMIVFFDINTNKWSSHQTSHIGDINDIVAINSDTFVTCSDDMTLKVWKRV